MEEIVYKESVARIKANDAYFTDNSVLPPAHLAWFEDQIEQALADTENKSYPFNRPAVFFQFEPTEYKNKGNHSEATGKIIVHVVQDKIADGIEDNESHERFKTLLEYYQYVLNLLDGYKLFCSAKPILSSVERGHLNSPLMHDKITFNWSGIRRREVVPSLTSDTDMVMADTDEVTADVG